MNLRRSCITTLLTLATGLPAYAQTISRLQDTRHAVGSPPMLFPATLPTSLESRPMPMDRIEKPVSLDDELAAIRAEIPDFNSVVVREPNIPKDYPTLPTMTLKNVTVGQFLQFVQASYPAVQIIRIDGLSGQLYSIRVRMEGLGGGGGGFFAQGTAVDPNRLHLYRLNEVVKSLADEKAGKTRDGKPITQDDAVKEATNDVLSLLQAALDQTDQDGPSVLKIHEPTLTLMFKGSRAKQEVLEEALTSLQPRNGRAVRFGGGGGGGSGGFGQGSNSDPWNNAAFSSSGGGSSAQSAEEDVYRQLMIRAQADRARDEAQRAIDAQIPQKPQMKIVVPPPADQPANPKQSNKD